MHAVQAGFPDSFKRFQGFAGNGFGSGIGRHAADLREFLPQKGQNRHQVIGFHDQVVGILKKTGGRAVIHPDSHSPITLAEPGTPRNMGNHRIIHGAVSPQLVGKLPDIVRNVSRRLNILLDFVNGSKGKFPALVHRTKQALIPGAVAGQAKQQAAGFVGGADRSLFKTGGSDIHIFVPVSLRSPMNL